jgi:hypothetical protein
MPGRHRNLRVGVALNGRYAEPQPGDEAVGGYSRDRLERMDQRFVSAVERAFRLGVESRRAAAVTYDLPPLAGVTGAARNAARLTNC